MSAAARSLPRLRARAPGSGLASVQTLPLGILMACAIAVVAALAYWDAQRESAAALEDFGLEQATLARSVAAALSTRVAALKDVALRTQPAELLSEVRALEAPGTVRLLLQVPGDASLHTTGGQLVRDAGVESALSLGTPSRRLTREEAVGFSLPRRTGVVGLSTFDGPGGRWGVVVAATALRERDREQRASLRLVSGVLVAAGLVLAFGGVALRKQRRQLELQGALAVAEIARERDAQLVQIDKLATLGALATGIAHEVSTPLGVILGRAEQLLPKVSHDEKAKKSVDSILEQGTRINGVIRGFLNLVRGDAPLMERVDPKTIAEAATELVEHRFVKAGVELELTAAPHLPVVSCEPRLIEQALINLLLNACDACESGGHVTLELSADGQRVAFIVTDDGVGITTEAASRAVEPFFTTKASGQGTGLGLAIANEIVKHHGGEISLRPRDPSGGRGTRACVELPVAEDAHD
jgi:two-component system, NtrC family, sensor kinase